MDGEHQTWVGEETERKCRYCGHIIFRLSQIDPNMCTICEEVLRKKEIEYAYMSIV